MPQPADRRPSPTPRPATRRSGTAAAAGRRRPRLRKRRVMRIAGALSLAVLTASGLVNVALGGLGAGLGRVDAFGGLDDRPPHGAGENFLLVGTDGRDRVSAADRRRYRLGGLPCHCADTIMLAHLSQDRSRLTVVSVPRDTYVRLPGPNGGPSRPAKINAAYSAGGPRLTVRTVERLTGVHIDHYVEVDFVSFMTTVDAIGGVPVCTAERLRDARAGLDLPAGRTLLTGGRALEYVRARHLDGSADLGRMRRQQRFLAELAHRAATSDVLLDPDRLREAVGTALDAVRADPGLTPADLVRLAGELRELRPAAARFASVPVTRRERHVPGAGAAVTWDAPRAARLFAAVRADRPLPGPGPGAVRHPAAGRPAVPVAVDPATVRVEVTAADPDAAWRAANALHTDRFRVEPPAGAGGTAGPHPVIAYDPRWDRSAAALAAALPGAERHAVARLGPVLRVTLGTGAPAVGPVRFDPLATTDRGADTGPLSGTDELCP